MDDQNQADEEVLLTSPLRRAIGAPQLLPDESAAAYQNELLSLIDDLNATTPLAVVLTEQLYEAILWARRHSADKSRFVIHKMAEVLSHVIDQDDIRVLLYEHLAGELDEDGKAKLDLYLDNKGYSLESLRAEATRQSLKSLKTLDELIARQLTTVRHMQKSLESLQLKPLLIRRLSLQIENLERDLQAIEHDNASTA